MRRRSFGRRPARRSAAWSFAGSDLIAVTDGAVPAWGTANLMPAQRVQWLCENQTRDSVTVVGILMWLEHWWRNPDAGGPTFNLPDVDMCVIRGAAGNVVAGNVWNMVPFTEPPVPSAIGAWDNPPESDGDDPFMWCHRIVGFSPPNWGGFAQPGGGSLPYGNVTSTITGNGQTSQQGPFRVSAMWQPDVHIRSKRRMAANEEIRLVVRTPGTNTGVLCNLRVAFRVLVK